MNMEMVMGIGKETLYVLLLMGAPMLIAGAVIGIGMSLVQTITQLRDQSLVFIPKIVGVFGALLFSAPFMVRTISGFMNHLADLAVKIGQGNY